MASPDSAVSEKVAAAHVVTKPRRKKKATGTRRKEEIEVLQQEVAALQKQVARLKREAKAAADDRRSTLLQDVLEAGFIRQAVLEQQSSLVMVQSALSKITTSLPQAPHNVHIHLGADLEERWATLMKLKPKKLRAAHLYLQERGRFVDSTAAFSNSTRHLEPDGSYCAQVYDVVPFEGVTSVKKVYDALNHYFSSMEIRVTETLGDVTIREDDGSSEPGVSQFRFVSYLSNGSQLEMNSIICSEYKEVDDEFGDGRAVGIFTEDFVDQDELYPYAPDERLRQDVIVVTRVRSHMVKHSADEQLLVVMERSALTKLHPTTLPLTTPMIHEIREKGAHWGDVKLDAVRQMVYQK